MKRRLAQFCLALALSSPVLGAEPAPPNARAVSVLDRAALGRELDALSRFVAQHRGRLGASFVELDSGAVIAAKNAETSLNPASNAKIFTAAAALARLGPAYRYRTSIHGHIDEAGVAERLVLRGHGDPSLTSRDIAALARDLARRGLKRVTGEIVVDQSRFDARFVPPAFEQQPNEWAAFRAPVSAVAVDRNAITVSVEPTRAGAPARALVDPPGVAEIAGAVTTGKPGRGDRVQLKIRATPSKLRVELGGELAAGAPRFVRRRRVDDPTLLPGRILAHYLAREGVALSGTVREGGAGERAELVFHRSQPLSILLYELGKQSDNFYAEMILKTIGAEASGAAGSSAAGAADVTLWLGEVGALDASTTVVNGSGLFDANRASAAALSRALAAGYRDPAISSELVAQLAIGGVDGTLRSRFRAHRDARAVRAKTGTLARAVALSGYVLVVGRSPIAFAIVVNDVPADKQPALRAHIDRVVERAVK